MEKGQKFQVPNFRGENFPVRIGFLLDELNNKILSSKTYGKLKHWNKRSLEYGQGPTCPQFLCELCNGCQSDLNRWIRVLYIRLDEVGITNPWNWIRKLTRLTDRLLKKGLRSTISWSYSPRGIYGTLFNGKLYGVRLFLKTEETGKMQNSSSTRRLRRRRRSRGVNSEFRMKSRNFRSISDARYAY